MIMLTVITSYNLHIAVLLGLILMARAATHWRPALVIDALAVALYAVRPVPATLVFIPVQALIRYVPELARQVALAFRVQSPHGWTRALVLLLLPGLACYDAPAAAPATTAPSSYPPAVTGATTHLPEPSISAARPLGPGEWIAALNEDEAAPHLGIIGPPRLGKTTLALVLVSRRPGDLVIATPKAADDADAWGGATCARPTIDLASQAVDWTPIAQAIGDVHFEMLRRNVENDVGAPPLTIVIDELSTTIPNIPPVARRQLVELWAMAPSCKIRVIVISQDVNARAWGVEGRRDILDSLVFARVAPGRRWSLGRLDPNGRLTDPTPLDTAGLDRQARAVRLRGREWGGRRQGAPCPVGAGVGAPPPPIPAQTNAHTQTQTDAEARIALYMEWRAAGMKKDMARALRNAKGAGIDDVEWAEAGKRLANGPS